MGTEELNKNIDCASQLGFIFGEFQTTILIQSQSAPTI